MVAVRTSTYEAPNASFGDPLTFTLPVAPPVGTRVIFAGRSTGSTPGTWTATTGAATIAVQATESTTGGTGDPVDGFLAYADGDGSRTVWEFTNSEFGTDKSGAAETWTGLATSAAEQAASATADGGVGSGGVALAG